MKKILKQFGKWSTADFVFTLLAAAIIIPTSIVLNIPVIFAIAGVLFVPCMVLAYKNTAFGYCAMIAYLVLYCFALYSLNMTGSMIAVGCFVVPLLVYRTIKMFVKKLDTPIKVKTLDFVLLFFLLALCAYPIYLLTKSVNSGFMVVETIMILFGFIVLFLESMGCGRWAVVLYPCLTILQLVMYVLFIIDLHLTAIPLLFGTVLALLSQTTNTIILTKKLFKSKPKDIQSKND